MNNILLALDGGNLLGYSIMEIPNTRFDTLGDIDFDAVSPASGDYVHTSSGFIENYPTENRKLINFLRKAKDNGAVISFDLNLRINEFGDAPDRMNDIREIVMLSDIVFGAFDEFESLSGLKIENAVELYSKGRLVIARNESDPIMFAKDSIKGTVKVEPVHVINPSGAGDTFDAAFIYAIERNDDLITCISFASYIAGYMISHEEKRAVPDKDTVRKLLEL